MTERTTPHDRAAETPDAAGSRDAPPPEHACTAVGTVYLVGAGPGDPGLLTLRGARLLRAADAVVFDLLANKELLDLVPPAAERIDVGKSGERGHTMEQQAINELLVDLARRHRTVVRLKGGDPFVFGRGGEELLHLHGAGVPCEVVPGVTSAVAAPACGGIPVTARDLAPSITLVTGHEEAGEHAARVDWPALAHAPGTLVCLMGVRRLERIAAALIAGGRDSATPAALVHSGTLPQQQVVCGTLADIAARARAAGVRPPAVFVVGEVVRLRAELAWFERRALFGRTVLVARPRGRGAELRAALLELGAQVVEIAPFRLVPPADAGPARRAAAALAGFDWLVLTSAAGVQALGSTLAGLGLDLRALGRARVAAAGPATAVEAARLGLRADLVAPRRTPEALLDALAERGLDGRRVLLWGAAEALDAPAEALRGRGATVEAVAAYARADEPVDEAVLSRVDAGGIDAVALTSGSCACALFRVLGASRAAALGRTACLAAIGPVTAAELRRLGLPVGVEASEHTLHGLARALAERFGGK